MIVRMAIFEWVAFYCGIHKVEPTTPSPQTELSLDARYHDVPAGMSFIGGRPKTCDRA